MGFDVPARKTHGRTKPEDENGVSTLVIGTEKKPRTAKLRPLGITGLFVRENDKDVAHPVFYRVPDAQEAVRILEAAGN